jgi:uncharacterized membrane protein (UPF0127 family)
MGAVTDQPSAAGAVSDARGTAWLRRAIWMAVALGALALLLRGADGPEDPVLAPARTEVGAAPGADGAAAGGCGGERAGLVPFEGFGEIGFRVTAPDGTTAFLGCAHLASSPETRAQGLMGRDGLGGYDAMVFRFDAPGAGAFYMYRTVLPLSIAHIGADGSLVSALDMTPCPEEEASACPTYPPAGPYLHAIEAVQGDLPRLGIVPGATVTFEAPA